MQFKLLIGLIVLLLVQLCTVNVCFNDFVVIPKEVSILTTLTNLQFWTNSLEVIPTEIGMLTNLDTLQDFSERRKSSFETLETRMMNVCLNIFIIIDFDLFQQK